MYLTKNIHLLQEYIKTFFATQVVFPGILPRQWGTPFSQSELSAIHFGLKFILDKAHPLQDRSMILAYDQIQETESLDLHWFLSDYWRELSILLKLYPSLGESYLANNN
ncbi:hypothetical protein GCM10028808_60350 [Spirosoma migulaei]